MPHIDPMKQVPPKSDRKKDQYRLKETPGRITTEYWTGSYWAGYETWDISHHRRRYQDGMTMDEGRAMMAKKLEPNVSGRTYWGMDDKGEWVKMYE